MLNGLMVEKGGSFLCYLIFPAHKFKLMCLVTL